jgi:thiol:disulfide interchange protein
VKSVLLSLAVLLAGSASAEIQIIDGVRYECKDGMCMPLEENPPAALPSSPQAQKIRVAQGYMNADSFAAFLRGEANASSLPMDGGVLLLALAVLLGGLMMNLTPCVLPMIPINLMIIGKSALRGTAYGAGITVAYGALGLAAAFGSTAFGSIQGNPWFNLAVASVFAVLSLSLFGLFSLDFSKSRSRFAFGRSLPLFYAFFMGALSAVLAGACVAPVLVSVLLLSAELYSSGNYSAVALPFVLGLGMALPWPLAGAGMKVLPKPGGWMKWVNRSFAVVVLGIALWYGYLAAKGFAPADASPVRPKADGVLAMTVDTFSLDGLKRPVLVDCWASWCKNCAAMDAVMEESAVREELKRFTVIKLQAENIGKLKSLEGFEAVKGLPAFVVFD